MGKCRQKTNLKSVITALGWISIKGYSGNIILYGRTNGTTRTDWILQWTANHISQKCRNLQVYKRIDLNKRTGSMDIMYIWLSNFYIRPYVAYNILTHIHKLSTLNSCCHTSLSYVPISVLKICSHNYFCKLQHSGPHEFSTKSLIFKVKGADTWWYEFSTNQHTTLQNIALIGVWCWSWYKDVHCQV